MLNTTHYGQSEVSSEMNIRTNQRQEPADPHERIDPLLISEHCQLQSPAVTVEEESVCASTTIKPIITIKTISVIDTNVTPSLLREKSMVCIPDRTVTSVP
jgi:hypothetical protein